MIVLRVEVWKRLLLWLGLWGSWVPLGGGNLVGDPNPNTEIAITKLSEQLSGAALTTFKQTRDLLDGGMRFRDDLPGDAHRLWVNVPKNSTLAKPHMTYGLALSRSNSHGGAISNPNLGNFYHPHPHPQPEGHGDEPRLYLVDPLKYPEFPDGNVYGFRVRPGNLVRVGVKSVSGATFCAILVRDGAVVAANSSSDVTGYATTDKSQLIPINGIGYQSTDAKGTSYRIAGTPGTGADCGAFFIRHRDPPLDCDAGCGNDHIHIAFVAELPGLPGTDTRLMPPKTDLYGCYSGWC